MRLQTIGETDEEGQVRVFFELNGQPRIVTRARTAPRSRKRPARRKAEEGNDAHVAAPMPGSVSTIAVQAGPAGQGRRRAADHRGDEDGDGPARAADGTVTEVLVTPGARSTRRILLVVMG